MKIVELGPNEHRMKEALEVLDKLRAEIESGRAVAFVGVTINREDDILGWCGAAERISRLRMSGAVSCLLSAINEGNL